MFEFFRKIDEDFGGTISWNTQPNCRASSQKPLHFCHHPFSGFFAGLIFNLPVCKRALLAEFTSRFRLIELTFGRMPIITKWFLDALLPLCVGGSEDGAVFDVGFARSSPSYQKLHWSPLEHCPQPFPIPVPLNPLRLVNTAPVSIFSFLASKFHNLSFWSMLHFTIVFSFWLSGIDIFWSMSMSHVLSICTGFPGRH